MGIGFFQFLVRLIFGYSLLLRKRRYKNLIGVWQPAILILKKIEY